MESTRQLEPLQDLYGNATGTDIPLPPRLAQLYGSLAFPFPTHGPYVITNFVESLDGIISLSLPGRMGGGEISGRNSHDRMVMGLVRAVADAVIITSTSLSVARRLLWTAATIFPDLENDYGALRKSIGLETPPLHVVVTGTGEVDVQHRVLVSGEVPAMLLTTEVGADEARRRGLRSDIPVQTVKSSGELGGREIVRAISAYLPDSRILLSEGGAQLLGSFLVDDSLDELFLTIAPQVVGRSSESPRTGLVEGHILAPDQPRWGELVSLKRAGNLLFTRYRFGSG